MDIVPGKGWSELLEKIKKKECISIIIGTTDSGKSTLAMYMIRNLLSEKYKLAFVDSDIGQSSIGLPGTVCLKSFKSLKDLNDLGPDRISFIGSFNPSSKIKQMIESTKRMVQNSKADGIKTIIIDTTGLVTGEIGLSLKTEKINEIKPQHIIAIQRHDELEHILSQVEGTVIHRLNVSPYVVSRSRVQRIRYREKKFLDYFNEPYRVVVSLKDFELFDNNKPFNIKERYLKRGVLLGLNDKDETIALGILDDVSSHELTILTRLKELRSIDRIVAGDIELNGLRI